MKNRHAMKTKEKKIFLSKLKELYPEINIGKKVKVEVAEMEKYRVIIIEDSLDFFLFDDLPVPVIPAVKKYGLKSRYVEVDEGAIKFILKGADVMLPGIVDADGEIKKDQPVWVKGEGYPAVLATGVALVDGEEMKRGGKGKAVKNLHHIGDKLWKYLMGNIY